MNRNRGAVLLEVSVALTLLAIATVALLELVGSGVRSERDSQERESTLAREERLLTAVSLLSRDQLDQRLGRRPGADFIIDVRRPEPTLYRIAVLNVRSPQVEDLVTVVYRPEPVP